MMKNCQSTQQIFGMAAVLRNIPIAAAQAGALRWFHPAPHPMLNDNNFGVYENDPDEFSTSSEAEAEPVDN